jgi:hypothetical protein
VSGKIFAHGEFPSKAPSLWGGGGQAARKTTGPGDNPAPWRNQGIEANDPETKAPTQSNGIRGNP